MHSFIAVALTSFAAAAPYSPKSPVNSATNISVSPTTRATTVVYLTSGVISAHNLTASGSNRASGSLTPSTSPSISTVWTVRLPTGLNEGQTYVLSTPCTASTVCDETILAGPAAEPVGGGVVNGGHDGLGDDEGESRPGGAGSSHGSLLDNDGSSSSGGLSDNADSSRNGGSSRGSGSDDSTPSSSCDLLSPPSRPPVTGYATPARYTNGTGPRTGYVPRPTGGYWYSNTTSPTPTCNSPISNNAATVAASTVTITITLSQTQTVWQLSSSDVVTPIGINSGPNTPSTLIGRYNATSIAKTRTYATGDVIGNNTMATTTYSTREVYHGYTTVTSTGPRPSLMAAETSAPDVSKEAEMPSMSGVAPSSSVSGRTVWSESVSWASL